MRLIMRKILRFVVWLYFKTNPLVYHISIGSRNPYVDYDVIKNTYRPNRGVEKEGEEK